MRILHLTDQDPRYLGLHPTFLVCVRKTLLVWMVLNPFLRANNCRRFLIELAEDIVQFYKSLILTQSIHVSCFRTHFQFPLGLKVAGKNETCPLSIVPARMGWEYLYKLISLCFHYKLNIGNIIPRGTQITVGSIRDLPSPISSW